LKSKTNEKKQTQWKKPIITHGKLTKYNYIVQYPENLKMGENFDIGTFSYLNCKYGVEIKDQVQIGSHCAIYSHSTIDNKHGKVIVIVGSFNFTIAFNVS